MSEVALMIVPPRPPSRFEEAVIAAAEKARMIEALKAVREAEQKLHRAGDLLSMAVAGKGSREDLIRDAINDLGPAADLVGAVIEEIDR